MTATLKFTDDVIDWSMSRDEEGHRTYKIKWQVETDNWQDGPATVLNAAGLPLIGTSWNFGNDLDSWAYCTPEATVKKHRGYKEGDRVYFWEVVQNFTTKPRDRCQNQSIDNPLQEPMKIGGSFAKYVKEALQDRNGKHILSSSHEQITGLEKDANRPSVWVEQNTLVLDLGIIAQMVDTVNDSSLWGLPARTIKLSQITWERKLYGTCNFYFTRRFEFDVNFNTFDLSDVADRGFKEYTGSGGTGNPVNFKVIKDENDENLPSPTMLDGNGSVNTDPVNNPVFLPTIQLYGQSNFLGLGIPTYIG